MYAPLAMYATSAGSVSGPLSGSLSIPNASTSLSFRASTRQMINLCRTGYGIGEQGDTLYTRSDNGFSWFKGGVHNDNQNNPGAGGTETMRLTGDGSLIVAGSTASFYASNRSNSASGWALYADGAGSANSFRLRSNATGTDLFTFSQVGRMAIVPGGNPAIGTASIGNGTGAPADVTSYLKFSADAYSFYNAAGSTPWPGFWAVSIFISAAPFTKSVHRRQDGHGFRRLFRAWQQRGKRGRGPVEAGGAQFLPQAAQVPELDVPQTAFDHQARARGIQRQPADGAGIGMIHSRQQRAAGGVEQIHSMRQPGHREGAAIPGNGGDGGDPGSSRLFQAPSWSP